MAAYHVKLNPMYLFTAFFSLQTNTPHTFWGPGGPTGLSSSLIYDLEKQR